jgi:hypothetical protein
MALAEAVQHTYILDFSAYPRWLVILVATLLAVVALWIAMKLLKWTLWILIFLVFVGGLGWAGWELLQ